MKREGTIGTAAFLTIAAAVGVSLQYASKQSPGGQAERGAPVTRSSQTPKRANSPELRPGCRSIEQQLQDFLDVDDAIAPEGCYGTPLPAEAKISKEITEKTSN